MVNSIQVPGLLHVVSVNLWSCCWLQKAVQSTRICLPMQRCLKVLEIISLIFTGSCVNPTSQ